MQLKVLTLQQAYYRELKERYIGALSAFTKTIYLLVVDDNYQLRAAPVVSNQIKIDKLIMRDIQDFIARQSNPPAGSSSNYQVAQKRKDQTTTKPTHNIVQVQRQPDNVPSQENEVDTNIKSNTDQGTGCPKSP